MSPCHVIKIDKRSTSRQPKESEPSTDNDTVRTKELIILDPGSTSMKGERNRWDPNGENLHPPPMYYARSALHRGYHIHPRRVVRRARGGSKTRYLTLQRVRFKPQISHRGGGSSYRSTIRSLIINTPEDQFKGGTNPGDKPLTAVEDSSPRRIPRISEKWLNAKLHSEDPG
ncbi:hypothetical protein LXL04_026058 [Taraxacum kok-saghyz]